jgi:hypothetical protein
MTVREKLIAKVWDCGYPDFPLDRGDTGEIGANWADDIVDAILTTLAEPDAETVEVMARVLDRATIPEMGEQDFGYDANGKWYQDCCRAVGRDVLAAMINHVRSGK